MGDLISRQAAIDAVSRGCEEFRGIFAECEKNLNELPSAEPEPQWIPCSERLPEKPNMYTVTDSKGDVVRFVFYDTESSREYWLRCAKAWMPLPEPYRLNEANEMKEGD